MIERKYNCHNIQSEAYGMGGPWSVVPDVVRRSQLLWNLLATLLTLGCEHVGALLQLETRKYEIPEILG